MNEKIQGLVAQNICTMPELTLDSLKKITEDLLRFERPAFIDALSTDHLWMNEEIKIPLMNKSMLFEKSLYSPIIADPMKFSRIICFNDIPDALPWNLWKLSLRQHLREFGYIAYALEKRQRRERKRS